MKIPKVQKDSQAFGVFAILESASVKAAPKTLMKLTPGLLRVSLEHQGFRCRQVCKAYQRPLDNEPSSWPKK